jgi:hypothetical protein
MIMQVLQGPGSNGGGWQAPDHTRKPTGSMPPSGPACMLFAKLLIIRDQDRLDNAVLLILFRR